MISEQSINSIRVWVRSLGNACRIRVEKEEYLRWLVERISCNPLYAGLKKFDLDKAREKCLLQISFTEIGSLSRLEEALSQIPGVQLMTEPEYK